MYNLEPHNSRIRQLKDEIEKRNREIYNCADRIEFLEDNVIELENIISRQINDPLYQNLIDTKVNILVKEKDLKIKELKHSLSFLRKELIILKRTYENGEINKKKGNLIHNNQQIPPLESLIQELQFNISKNKLKLKHYEEEREELNNLLKIKRNLINSLQTKNEVLALDLDGKKKEINKLKNTITQLELMFLEARKSS
ncbi:MAG: hypothetical protein KGD57_10650 [Candidatus Lokiarchaeota archaeon]|nr:hypothetical protein [Candidatus Lokiarchaeota archaeon]